MSSFLGFVDGKKKKIIFPLRHNRTLGGSVAMVLTPQKDKISTI